ncbi:cytokinin riboside 5'-monophosphate phosphoribohydrolase, partial [Phenoliferia sp. Uapishka_3]
MANNDQKPHLQQQNNFAFNPPSAAASTSTSASTSTPTAQAISTGAPSKRRTYRACEHCRLPECPTEGPCKRCRRESRPCILQYAGSIRAQAPVAAKPYSRPKASGDDIGNLVNNGSEKKSGTGPTANPPPSAFLQQHSGSGNNGGATYQVISPPAPTPVPTPPLPPPQKQHPRAESTTSSTDHLNEAQDQDQDAEDDQEDQDILLTSALHNPSDALKLLAFASRLANGGRGESRHRASNGGGVQVGGGKGKGKETTGLDAGEEGVSNEDCWKNWKPVKEGVVDQREAEALFLFQGMTAADRLFSNVEITRAMLRTGQWESFLRSLEAELATMRRNASAILREENLSSTLVKIELDYVLLYGNAVTLRALQERLKRRMKAKDSHFKAPSILNLQEGRWIIDALAAAQSILHLTVSVLEPKGYLRLCPARIFQRILFSAVFLFKSLAVGVVEHGQTTLIDLLDRTISALYETSIDENHLSRGFSALLGSHFFVSLLCGDRMLTYCASSNPPGHLQAQCKPRLLSTLHPSGASQSQSPAQQLHALLHPQPSEPVVNKSEDTQMRFAQQLYPTLAPPLAHDPPLAQPLLPSPSQPFNNTTSSSSLFSSNNNMNTAPTTAPPDAPFSWDWDPTSEFIAVGREQDLLFQTLWNDNGLGVGGDIMGTLLGDNFDGGGMSGIMGKVALSVLDNGGRVHGVIPRAFLASEIPDAKYLPVSPEEEDADHRYIQSAVGSMHERKGIMAELCRGFLALPGGYGTLEEVAEMTTWTQLGIPVILLNVLGFFTPLRDFVEKAISSGFVAEQNRAFLIFVDAPTDSSGFDWGTAALKAVADWEAKGLGGGIPHSLEWGSKGVGADLQG